MNTDKSMPFKDFDEQFNREKKMEIYNNIRVNQPFFARLDGWAFHTFTKKMKFIKPFDKTLTQRLVDATSKTFDVFKPTFAYCFSDEISFFFREPTVFNRLEKIDSLLPSFFASVFSVTNSTACFDCRIVPVTEDVDIIDYLIWRQSECRRNFLNGWAEGVLATYDNLSASRIAKALKGLDGKELRELCLSKGVDLDTVPQWQQNGIILYIKTYFKNGYNPITKENVLAERHQVKEDWGVPEFRSTEGKEYISFLLSLNSTP